MLVGLAGDARADVNQPALLFPVDCTLGQDCFIQQYVDRDPGKGAVDFSCGPLSFDGHKGTDIRLIDDAAVASGYPVLSSTEGVVIGRRDGMPDIRHGVEGAPDVSGKECGNGVMVLRPDGWRFQYCHLRRGSVRVRKGQAVAAGDPLGQIGLSGNTEFPHLELTVYDKVGRVIDPFDTREQYESCTLPDTRTFWAQTPGLVYQAGGILAGGFLERVPTYPEVKRGLPETTVLDADAGAMVVWVHIFGPRKDDIIRLTLTGPDGAVVAQSDHRMTRNRATEYRATGRRARGSWPPGRYVGEALLLRDGSIVASLTRDIVIE